MHIMPYGSLWRAEKNSGSGCSFRVTDEQWDIVARSLRGYEEGVHRYFGYQPDKRVWVGDSYIMYGDSGPLEMDSLYSGVRLGPRKRIISTWLSVFLSDRDEESYSFDLFGSFDLAWKHVLWDLVRGCFLYSERWEKGGRRFFFEKILPPGVLRIEINSDGFPSGGFGEVWDSFISRTNLPPCNGPGSPSYMGSGSLICADMEKDLWYHTRLGNLFDIAYSFYMDPSDWVDLLFEAGFSELKDDGNV